MAKSAPSKSVPSSTLAMRKRAKREEAAGYRRVTLALSPPAHETLDAYMARTGFTSRQAALNAILERIADDMFLRQEFLAVSG